MERNPKLRKCDMKKCQAYCCYDGVYLKSEDVDKLKKVIIEHPEDFPLSAEEYFESSNWNNKVKGIKTAVRPYNYPKDFPKHFNQTRCVFADDNGLCILQKIAIREKKHPWAYKPLGCCLFPLIARNGKLVPPPERNDLDDYYVDETYPGFVNCLYCGKDVDDGKDWKEVLKEEIQYFNTNKDN